MATIRSVATALAVSVMFAVPASTPALSQMDATANQVEEVEPLYVDIRADPAFAFISEPVKLVGTTMASDQAKTVSIVVTRPDTTGDPLQPTDPGGRPQEPVTLTAEVDDNGAYLVVFEDTVTPGIYSATVTAPDGRGTAVTEFEMLDAPDVPDEVEEVVLAPLTAAEEHAALVEDKLDDLPDSPAKDEAKQKIAEVRQKIGKMKENASALTKEIANAILASQAYPSLHDDMRVMRNNLLGKFQEVRREAMRSAAEIKRMNQQTATCDSFEVIVEGLKWTSTMMDFLAGSVKAVAFNFAKEAAGMIASAKATQKGGSENASFVASEVAKNADAIAKWEMEGATAIGLNLDFLAAGAMKMMRSYCEVYTGPVKAHMSAEFYSNGTKWWTYEMDVNGTITLHYPKDAGAGAIPLKGRIEGFGSNFKMWENALTVLYPNLMSSAVQKKRVIPPIEGPGMVNDFATGLGSVAASGMPNSYFIAVDGVIDNEVMSVIIGPARTDMAPKARVLALVLSPLVTFPILTSYELPYKEAHFVFLRASKGVAMDIPIISNGKVMKGEQTFTAKKGDGDARGEYSVTITLCNPGC